MDRSSTVPSPLVSLSLVVTIWPPATGAGFAAATLPAVFPAGIFRADFWAESQAW